MDEPEFWRRLEYRVCEELAGFGEPGIRHLWCDGFVSEQYILDGESPRIVGRAWVGVGQRRQEQWEFALLVGRSAAPRELIDRDRLLPPPHVTKWLSVDPVRKQLTLEPGVAVPDPR